MNIVLTGSLGNIGRPLTKDLVNKGHRVTLISSNNEREKEIEKLGAKAAIGTFKDVDFLSSTFKGADIVYLMEAWEGIGSIFDNSVNFEEEFRKIGNNYKNAINQSGVKRIVHLSSIGAHTSQGTGSLYLHNLVENILKELSEDIAIKFIRPVGFYTNLYRNIQSIKEKSVIVSTYGGDKKEPWVSPIDIARAISEEMEKPFEGRKVRYLASDEVSPNQIAELLGDAIGNPNLKWVVIPEEDMLKGMLDMGMNEWIAKGFIAMQAAQKSGSLYEDFYYHKPILGRTKFKDFAKEFANNYKN